MRILPVRPGSEAEDIGNGRKTLAAEIAHPAKTVIIIRGNEPHIGQFADRAAVRSDSFGFREAVWVQSDEILTEDQIAWFKGHERVCAVVLDFDDKPIVWLGPDSTLFEIEKAFLVGQQGG